MKAPKTRHVRNIDADGDEYWYKNGKLHRDAAPAIQAANGNMYWYQNDELYREDGPAVEAARGNKFWYQHNELHRTDGPAIEWDGVNEYHVRGTYLTHAEFASRMLDKETALLWKMSGYCWPFDFGANKNVNN
jgi:hypothetical protein